MSTKILFIGPNGVGKSRAIEFLTGRPLMRMPLENMQEGKAEAPSPLEVGYALLSVGSEAPTVLMRMPALENLGTQLFHSGLPGALGAVLLLDHRAPDVAHSLERFVRDYAVLARRQALAVVVNHVPVAQRSAVLGTYRERLRALHLALPVFVTASLSHEPLMAALETLVTNAEVEIAHSIPLSDFSPLRG